MLLGGNSHNVLTSAVGLAWSGMAILSTPYAISHGGWLSLPLLFVFAIVFFNTAILLKHCLESRDGLKTYPDVGEAAFGQTGRWLIAVLLYIELYSITVELLILEVSHPPPAPQLPEASSRRTRKCTKEQQLEMAPE